MDDDGAPIFEDNDFGDGDMRGEPPRGFLPPIVSRGAATVSRDSGRGPFPSSRLATAAMMGHDQYPNTASRMESRPFSDLSGEHSLSGAGLMLQEMSTTSQLGGDARARIQLLSKKNRELTALVGGEQSRSKKLASQNAELEAKVLSYFRFLA